MLAHTNLVVNYGLLLTFISQRFIIPNGIIKYMRRFSMKQDSIRLINELNKEIIKLRGTYSLWSGLHHISYNEMLVLYTIREYGFCSQKQVCDNYLLPRQTINNVITRMRKDDILRPEPKLNIGREKAFVLTEHGHEYAGKFMDSISEMEVQAVSLTGTQKLEELLLLLSEHSQALQCAMKDLEMTESKTKES